jgi:RimJ/RimL family protein N-acetyltransferase
MHIIIAPDPELTDEVVRLRRFALTDAQLVAKACQDPEIARWTSNIPSPYKLEHAEEWIRSHPDTANLGEALDLAIVEAVTGDFAGSIGLVGFD